MAQCIRAKDHWRTMQHQNESIFPFRMFPGLIEMIDRRTPTNARVVLFGGGRGHLSRLLNGNGRTFTNLDICDVREPFIHTIQHDMEQPIERARLVQNGEAIAIITPFSLEYTDPRLTTSTIANILMQGERFVCACYNSRSDGIGEARKLKELLPLLLRIQKLIGSTSSALPMKELERVNTKILKLFKFKFPNFFIAPNNYLSEMKESLQKDGINRPSQKAKIVLVNVALAERRQITREELSRVVNGIANGCQREVDLLDASLGRKVESPRDLAGFVDRRLRLVGGEFFSPENRPLAIVASFERV